jgi:hypothetical protein
MMGGLTLYRAQPPMVIETSLVKELLEKLLNRKRYLDSFLLKRFQYYKY